MIFKNRFPVLVLLGILMGCNSPDPDPVPQVETGWAAYFESSYSRQDPHLIPAGQVYFFEWENVDSLTLEKPETVDTWLRNEAIDPTGIGDAYLLRVDFEIKSTSPSNNTGELVLDIGGNQGEIQNRPFAMATDLWLPESKTMLIYTLGTFKSNGGRIGIRARNQGILLGRYSVTLAKIHSPDI